MRHVAALPPPSCCSKTPAHRHACDARPPVYANARENIQNISIFRSFFVVFRCCFQFHATLCGRMRQEGEEAGMSQGAGAVGRVGAAGDKEATVAAMRCR